MRQEVNLVLAAACCSLVLIAQSFAQDASLRWRELDAALNAEPFTSSIIAFELVKGSGPQLVAARAPDRSLSIGTTAMVWTHLALLEAAANNELPWDAPILFDSAIKTWPRSDSYELPEGIALPVAEWTRRMMSQTDNIAADHLIAIIGADRIESTRDRVRAGLWEGAGPRRAPVGGEPFLTTAQFHALKCNVDLKVLDCYAYSGLDERRRILEDQRLLALMSEQVMANWFNPLYIETVGWFATSRELAAAAIEVDLLTASPGMEPAAQAWRLPAAEHPQGPWARVHGKLGGEPGALAGVWLLERRDGRRFVLAMIFNNPRQIVPEHLGVRYIQRTLATLAVQ